ncbi:hypothetical protein ACFQ0R_01850 [Psychroflexus salinarum]|uniref:DUF4465 domain-containing protein n=1 Tax=Psychroflexus salinarum TaxID=546024 RepID=A0ABW3GRC7_9FLAO
MKNLKHTFAILVATIFVFTSCETTDDVDPPISNPFNPPTAEAYSNLKDEAKALITEFKTFNAEDGLNFISSNGVDITLPPNSLTLNGDVVSGEVELEYKEIFDRGTMLSTNKTTMGRHPNGDKSLLISGGEFYINAIQNGEQLELNADISLVIPSGLTGGGDQNMTLWDGEVDENDNLTWEEEEQDPAGRGGVFLEGDGANGNYYAYFDSFGWTNVDRFYNDPRPKTMILVDVPDGFDNTNSAVYLSYDGEGNNALANLDTYDPNTELFSEHYGQIPVGLEMHIIFATEDDGQWRYAIKGVTVAENDVYSFTMSETTLGSLQQMTDAINDLP